MSRWRIAVLVVLSATPFVGLAAVGGYYLWERSWSLYAGWAILAFLVTAYVLGWYWQRNKQLVRPLDFTPPLHWTDRDRQAWQLVEARAKASSQIDPNRLTEVPFYTTTAQEMALELARFYHPGTQDPLGPLTIPELLAVIELAAHDLAEMVAQYVPAGHLLTVQDWRRAKQATEWYQTASKAYWMVSALFSPINTGARYLASQLGTSRPWQMIQENLFVWFYTAFVHRLGTYLIELNSGRLRVGAQRYRELLQPIAQAPAPPAAGPALPADDAEQVRRVTLTLLGQVKAGKSSLVNALLGEERAKTAVVPTTMAVTRYEVQPPGIATRLVLLDTIGYHHTDPRTDQFAATVDAAQQSDLLLLVMHARNPARQADLAMLRGLREWFGKRPDLKMPKVLGVLTHIDLLSPALEWQPPYNWQQPERLKERQIGGAVDAAHDQLGEYLVGVAPVCTAREKVHGVTEWLLPAVAQLLNEAQAVAFLRCLRAEADTGKVRKVFSQLLAAGQQAAKLLWQSAAK
jgi:predicted GTPase